MVDLVKELRVGLKFLPSDGHVYDFLKSIPKLHRGYELKKIILGGNGNGSFELKGEETEVIKKERTVGSKVKETLKF